jgi:hypothetical protein
VRNLLQNASCVPSLLERVSTVWYRGIHTNLLLDTL